MTDSAKHPKSHALAREARERAEDYRRRGLPSHFIKSQESIARNLERTARAFEPPEVRFLFTGEPVIGQEGIAASFLGEMLQHLSKAVKIDMASHNAMPNEGDDFFVAGIATGSFGVTLRDLSPQQTLLEEDSRLSRSGRTLAESIATIATGDDEAIDARLGESSSLRGAIKKLLSAASERGAGIKLEGTALPETSWVRMEPEDVAAAAFLLERIQEREELEQFRGMVLGFLPNARQAEIKLRRAPKGPAIYDVDEHVNAPRLQKAMNRWSALTFRKRVIEYPTGYTRTKRTLTSFKVLPEAVQLELDRRADDEDQ